MRYPTFFRFNAFGGTIWVISLTLLGYFFGNLSFVRENFETVIFGIIGLSLLPMVFAFIQEKLKTKA
jgi:membrane-associated protein